MRKNSFYPKLWHAVAAIALLNAFSILLPFHLNNWDSETHLFLADHYQHDWFSPWDHRWMTGFWVWGYPPLTHHLIALIGFVTGLENAYKIVQAIFLVGLPISTYCLVKPLTDEMVSGWAALIVALVPGSYVTLYSFGQIPTFAGLVLALASAAWLVDFLIDGQRKRLVGLATTVAATMTAHHFTVATVVPFLFIAVALSVFLTRRIKLSSFLGRLIFASIVTGIATAVAIVPFWWWYFNENLPQSEIPHATRRMFFDNRKETELFFLGMYGILLITFPISLWTVIWKAKKLLPICLLVILLGVLGLGTNTLLPSKLFFVGGMWNWFTYDRFAFWAAILATIPTAVWLAEMSRKGTVKVVSLVLILMALIAAREATLVVNDRVQPPPLADWEVGAIAGFLEKDRHDQWRYVTFGLGESGMARISRATTAQNIDGTYFTGRIPKEFRESGIGVFDAARWYGELSYKTIFPILQNPEKWNLKWAISADPWMNGHLKNSGWELLYPLGGNVNYDPYGGFYSLIMIWKVPDTHYVPALTSFVPDYPHHLAVMWGILPLLFFVTSLTCLLGVSNEKSYAPYPELRSFGWYLPVSYGNRRKSYQRSVFSVRPSLGQRLRHVLHGWKAVQPRRIWRGLPVHW